MDVSEQVFLSLRIVSFNGDLLCRVTVCPRSTGKEVMDKVADELRTGCQNISLSVGTNALCSRTAVLDQNISDGSCISMTRLLEPENHDGVQECDGCGYVRFCFHGYACCPFSQEYEAVISNCQSCGGEYVDVGARLDMDDSSESSFSE